MTSATPAVSAMTATVIIIVAAMIRTIWIGGSLHHRLRLGNGLRRGWPRFIGRVALDDLVQLPSVQPNAAAAGAIVDLDALSIRHRKIDATMGAQQTIIRNRTY